MQLLYPRARRGIMYHGLSIMSVDRGMASMKHVMYVPIQLANEFDKPAVMYTVLNGFDAVIAAIVASLRERFTFYTINNRRWG